MSHIYTSWVSLVVRQSRCSLESLWDENRKKELLMSLRSKVALLVSAVALSAMGTAASADSIQIFGPPVLSPAGGGNTNFAYTVQVTAGNQINPGDFFTLVDFTGFVSVGAIPAGWALFSSAGYA